jgi:IclR family pca regulon transcriptional regulator
MTDATPEVKRGAMPEKTETLDQRDYVQSLERGFAVILAFADHRPQLTLAQVAEATGLSRPTARRMLMTLQALGFVKSEGRLFSLTPRVLTLGHAYLSSLDLTAIAQPVMEGVVQQAQETCTLAMLDDTDIVYVSRVAVRRVSTATLAVGTRLPAYATAMGQVLLADLPAEELDRLIARVDLARLTPRTITDPQALQERLRTVRRQGWAYADQELEEGLRSIATAVRGSDGRVFAALGMSSARPNDSMVQTHLPLLQEAADEIGKRLGNGFSRA